MPPSPPHPLVRTPTALVNSNLPTKRLKVMELLCYRKSVRGRATVVFCVREVVPHRAKLSKPEPEAVVGIDIDTVQDAEGADTLLWRESERELEGERLEKPMDIYGRSKARWSGQCLDTTPDLDEILGFKNLMDLNIEVADGEDAKRAEYSSTRTGDNSMMHTSCLKRAYCQVSMPTVGEPLCAAESPRSLLEAVLDAIISYWNLFNKGMLCREMNDGNVLILRGGPWFDRQQRKERRTRGNATSVRYATTRSEVLLQENLERLGRDPRGFLLSELCLDSSCPRMQAELAEIRQVTPMFAASRLLDLFIDRHVTYPFLDDLEPFFWLILWATVGHLDPQVRRRTSAALDILNGFDQSNVSNIRAHKEVLMLYCHRFGGRKMRQKLTSWGNAWASDPMVVSVIVDLGAFFLGIDYDDFDNPDYDPSVVFPRVVDIFIKALGIRTA
ncbi:hypothetical protein FS749_005429 [Ceratobasidium sp. UAMH 11750]|nr:hypothetical protein FS749_005429 [Ceratobasidium sp. UAMH 11750]